MREQKSPSENGKTNMRYILEDGIFDLWTESYANINCDMNFGMYPFELTKGHIIKALCVI